MLGTCTCQQGMNGNACPHQAAVALKFGINSLNVIPQTAKERMMQPCYPCCWKQQTFQCYPVCKPPPKGNRLFLNCLAPLFQSEASCNLSYENEFKLDVNGNSFSYERLCTKTLFEEEVQGNLEMTY